MGAVLTVKPFGYYTDGEALVQVITVDDDGLWVEDCKTLELVQATHTDFVSRDWREVVIPETADG